MGGPATIWATGRAFADDGLGFGPESTGVGSGFGSGSGGGIGSGFGAVSGPGWPGLGSLSGGLAVPFGPVVSAFLVVSGFSWATAVLSCPLGFDRPWMAMNAREVRAK